MLSNCTELKWYSSEISSTRKEDEKNNESVLVCNIGVIGSGGVIGSAFVQFGDSRVICSLSGPLSLSSVSANQSAAHSTALNSNIDRCTFECNVKFAPFTHAEESYDRQEKSLSNYLREALQSSMKLDMYPKSNFTLNCVVLQSSFSHDLAALINCGSLALADASIELYDLVSSFSLPSESRLNAAAVSIATFSFMSSIDRLCHINISGRLDGVEILGLMENSRLACANIRSIMSETLLNKLMQSLR